MSGIEIKEQVHLLVEESDEQILRAVKAMLEAYHAKSSEEEIEDLNHDIEESEKELEKGESYTQEEVIKMSDQWKYQRR